jgi:hypothetical protein
MTPIENATLDFWCAAFARRRDLPMTNLDRVVFDDVCSDLTTGIASLFLLGGSRRPERSSRTARVISFPTRCLVSASRRPVFPRRPMDRSWNGGAA